MTSDPITVSATEPWTTCHYRLYQSTVHVESLSALLSWFGNAKAAFGLEFLANEGTTVYLRLDRTFIRVNIVALSSVLLYVSADDEDAALARDLRAIYAMLTGR